VPYHRTVGMAGDQSIMADRISFQEGRECSLVCELDGKQPVTPWTEEYRDALDCQARSDSWCVGSHGLGWRHGIDFYTFRDWNHQATGEGLLEVPGSMIERIGPGGERSVHRE